MSKKETRIMKVTLDEDEFKKFDSGETHSDSGIRNDKGKLSALPDIAPISDDDLPYREVVRTEYVHVENDKTTMGEVCAEALTDAAKDILSDPDVQEYISLLFKTLWQYRVKPKIKEIVNKLKGENEDRNSTQSSTDKKDKTTESKASISSDDAILILQEMQKKAHELAAMISFISSVSIKDEKTHEEYTLEKEYVNFLITEEAKKTMEFFTNNPIFSDKETVQQFSDCLKGYVINGDRKIPLYLEHENEKAEK